MRKNRKKEAIILSLEDPKKESKKYTLNKQKKKACFTKKRNN